MNRYAALDSWRGIAACMVALFHLPAYSHAYDIPLLRNSYLFVDFFFVLSGFVIAANYYERLLDGFGLGRFMWLRLGRLYPLHIAVLGVYVAYRLVQVLFPALAGDRPPFSAPQESADTIIANLTMTQGLNVFDFLTWNYPSWSIGAEFFTYLVFAVALVLTRRLMPAVLLAAIVACPLALLSLKGHIVATYDYSLIRCIYGFAAGALVWLAIKRAGHLLRGTAVELTAIALMVGFVSVVEKTAVSLLAPAVFAFAVLAFAPQAGAVSRLLLRGPFLMLGVLSYSIYMVHAFISARMFTVAKVVTNLTGMETSVNHGGVALMGTSPWIGDLCYPIYLALVIAVSWLTYRFVEAPWRAWFRSRRFLTAPSCREPKSYPTRLGRS